MHNQHEMQGRKVAWQKVQTCRAIPTHRGDGLSTKKGNPQAGSTEAMPTRGSIARRLVRYSGVEGSEASEGGEK